MKKIRLDHFKYLLFIISNKRFYITETVKFSSLKKKVLINGFAKSTNFGDALNVPLVEFLSERRAIVYKYLLNNKRSVNQQDHYTVIGSILQFVQPGSCVWGAGFISDTVSVFEKPKKVFAVRGPLSREIYLMNGVECPEVYGDPALLLPLIYNPEPSKREKVGVIPHYVDKKNGWVLKQSENKDVSVIDIETGYNWKGFIDEVSQCRAIITSSLHAIIIANAYNIPSVWVSFSDKVTGGSFKFTDYYLSVGKDISSPIYVKQDTPLDELLMNLDYQSNKIDLSSLIEACPFATTERKDLLLSKLK